MVGVRVGIDTLLNIVLAALSPETREVATSGPILITRQLALTTLHFITAVGFTSASADSRRRLACLVLGTTIVNIDSLSQLCRRSLVKSVKQHNHQEETTLNGSEPPFSSPTSTACLTAPRYSASLRPSGCKKSS